MPAERSQGCQLHSSSGVPRTFAPRTHNFPFIVPFAGSEKYVRMHPSSMKNRWFQLWHTILWTQKRNRQAIHQIIVSVAYNDCIQCNIIAMDLECSWFQSDDWTKRRVLHSSRAKLIQNSLSEMISGWSRKQDQHWPHLSRFSKYRFISNMKLQVAVRCK